MQASDAHPKASDGHPKASDGRTKAANGQFICTAKKLSQCFIEKEYLLYERRQSASRRQKTARHTSQSRFLQMTKAALSMTESHRENDRKPPCSNKKKLRDGTHRAALFTFYYSLFTSAGLTFHFHKRELPYITPIQCSTYGARMAVKMPLRVRPSEA